PQAGRAARREDALPYGSAGRVTRPGGGRMAQRESASFTPRRSLVRSQYRPRCKASSVAPRTALILRSGWELSAYLEEFGRLSSPPRHGGAGCCALGEPSALFRRQDGRCLAVRPGVATTGRLLPRRS